ncbi:MAG: DNA polymerase III subunit delta, partial [Desulfovibrio sp.]|nr:DNA polymerase III subunit delta [Desulfovibrio sp.]
MDPKKAPPKTRPAFYLFICPDSFLCQAKLKQMLAATPLKSGAWQKRIYWGDEEPTASFFEQFNSGSLLGESTCLLVYNCQAWSAATFKKLETAFRNLAPSCWPFLAFQGAWKAGEP